MVTDGYTHRHTHIHTQNDYHDPTAHAPRVKNVRYSPEMGMMTDVVVERSVFSHASMLVVEATKVRLLVITLIPFVLELFVSTADVFEPATLRLVNRGSLDKKVSVLPLIIHASVFEFAVVQVTVTVSPEHTDCLSQVIEVVSMSTRRW